MNKPNYLFMAKAGFVINLCFSALKAGVNKFYG